MACASRRYPGATPQLKVGFIHPLAGRLDEATVALKKVVNDFPDGFAKNNAPEDPMYPGCFPQVMKKGMPTLALPGQWSEIPGIRPAS